MLKKLKLFDMSIYDKYFENKIIFRGEQISRLGHIKNISNYNNLYKYFIRDDELVNRINSVIEKKNILNNAYGEYNKGRLKYLMNKSKEENSNRVNDNSNKSNNSIFGAILLIGLKSLFSLGDKNETPNYSKYTNKEINNFDLENWQKDLVKSGNYDPNNFGEDDDMEPDDYYYDEDRKKEIVQNLNKLRFLYNVVIL